MDLPISVIIILTVSVLVMVVVGSFFLLQSSQSFGIVTDDSARFYGCAKLVQGNLTSKSCCAGWSSIIIDGYKLPGRTNLGTLEDACRNTGFTTEEGCKKVCGCDVARVMC